LNLSVNPILTSTTNTTICTAQLPYTWNGQSYNAAGIYNVTLTAASGCDSIATLNLTVNSTVASITSTTICTTQLPYTWNGQSYNAAGIYNVILTALSGCDSVASLVLSVENNITGVRYPTVTASPNTPQRLLARNPGANYTYTWSPSAGLDFNNVRDPVFTYDKKTEYIITLTSPAGCVTVDTLLVDIIVPQTTGSYLFVPKAWTPNGDGHNDYLYPLAQNIVQLKYFRVFNRWGQLMFETNMTGKGWDGNYNGKPQVMDVYTWTAEAISVTGEIIKRTGVSVLIR
jgi:gliding motility-associated-like protein